MAMNRYYHSELLEIFCLQVQKAESLTNATQKKKVKDLSSLHKFYWLNYKIEGRKKKIWYSFQVNNIKK